MFDRKEIAKSLESALSAARAEKKSIACISIPIPQIDPLTIASASKDFPTYYYRSRSKSIEVLGIGETRSFVGEDSTEEAESFLSNFTGEPRPPVFCSSYFDSEKVSTELWNKIPLSKAVLPSLSIIRKGAKYLCLASLCVDEEDGTNRILALLDYFEFISSESEIQALPLLLDRNDLPDKGSWIEAVDTAKTSFNRGELIKVVLARLTKFTSEENIDPGSLLQGYSDLPQDTYLYMIRHKVDLGFLGATPELLIRITNGTIETEALAGTVSSSVSDASQVLLDSRKDRFEQDLVLQDIQERLSGIADNVTIEDHPDVLRLANVQHLRSRIWAERRSDVSLSQIINAIAPTPAVCGTPRTEAREFINEHEPFPRGLYAGTFGIMYGAHLEFSVSLRCSLIKGNQIYMFAGAGIVSESDPELEWEELDNKLESTLSLFRTQRQKIKIAHAG